MALPTTERIKDFILINHPYMTKAEMAEELKSTSTTIGYHCKLMNIIPITLRERACECIEKFKHLTKEELAIKLGMTSYQVHDYAKDMGIELATNKKQEIKARITENGTLPSHQRAAAIYNQSGSQLTDELKGIKTTTRVQVNASDAFFK